MDALTDALDSLRLKSSLYCVAYLSAPWGLRFLSSSDAVFHVVDREGCWLLLQGETIPIALTGGDFFVLPHGSAHTITDTPTTTSMIDVEIGTTTPLEYQTLDYATGGVYTSLLCGTFHLEHQHGYPFLSSLPALLHIRGSQGQGVEWLDSTLKFLMHEASRHEPGTEIIVKRLADILLIKAIRFWIDSQEGDRSGWLGALHDVQMSTALSLIHRYPDRRWSVEALAREVAMSRSAFSARFKALVGTPPLQYLTVWRMHQATVYLEQNKRDIKGIAQAVGYDSEFALSKAFKRHFGIAPSEYRRSQTPK